MNTTFTKTHRRHLLGTASAMALIITTGSALAQEVEATTGDFVLGINQALNGFLAETITVESTTSGDVTTTENEAVAVTESTLNVGSTEGNVISASLTGNLASSVLTSDTNNDLIGAASSSMVAGVEEDGRLRAVASSTDANLAVNTVQNVNETEGVVSNASTVGSFTSDVTESSVSVVDNTQEGIGILNRNSSTIEVTANATNASVGIATSQNVTPSTDGNPILDVETSALTGISAAAATTLDGDVDETTLDLSGNSQTAVAAGNVGSNTINANATDISAYVDSASTTIDLTTPDSDANATAGYAVASSQVVDVLGDGNEMLATVDGSTAGFEIDVDGLVDSSTLTNDSNSASALLIGNEVANAVSMSGNSIVTIDETTDEPVTGAAAAISSLQIFNADATATAMADAGQAVRTIVGTTATDATLTTSSNTVAATAIGNTGANHVTAGVDGGANSINTTGGGTSAPPASADAISGLSTNTVSTTGAGFELSSAQTSSGSITATLQSDGGSTSASIATDIGGDIESSTVASNGNTLSATATANEITTQTNEIEVTGNTVSTTTALANFQSTDADVSAVVGAPGTPAIASETVPQLTFTNSTGAAGGQGTDTLPGGLAQSTIDDYLETLEALGSISTATESGGTVTVTFADATVSLTGPSGQFGGSSAIPGSGGVTVASGGTIANSTITVDGNTTQGTVTGNTATNRISVSATNLSGGGTATTSTAADDSTPSLIATTVGSATADNALASVQSFSSELDTNVAGTFGIVSDLATYDTENSTLSVSGNRMFATTQGNVVDNSIELTATNATATGAALSSLQADADGASVTAESQMDVYAPAAMEGSTLLLNDNRNEAVATVNTATNSADVSATNMDSISSGANTVLESSLTTAGFQNTAEADVVIASSQAATGPVEANATSSVRNQDDFISLAPVDTDGVLNSSASVNGNVTLAQGSANRATNMLSLDGASDLEVTGGILNLQASTSSVQVNASMDAGLTLLNNGGNTIDSSSVEISGNGTSAQASGNVSTNSLNASALNLTATGGAATVNLNTGNIGDGGVSATYGVLNNQVNDGPVEAIATATYTLNSTSGDGFALNNAMVGMAGNVIEASAVGNSSTNSVTLSALNYGASTAAIGNEQLNTADITASVSNGMIGSSNSGGVNASSIGLNGNSITSSAIGNRSVNTISRR